MHNTMKDLTKIIQQCCDGDNRHKWAKYIDVEALHNFYVQFLRANEIDVNDERLDLDDESVCPHCGATLQVEAENVGFNEPGAEHIEILISCPNGCDL